MGKDIALTPAEVAALERACANIPRIRQASLSILLTDPSGRPLSGIPVRVEQKQHRFPFGGLPHELQQIGAISSTERPVYDERFFAIFNQVLWTGFSWRPFERTRGERGYAWMDRNLEWSARYGATVRGHALVYTNFHPSWFLEIPSPEEQRRVAETHVRDLASRYRGRVQVWDVVNEAKNTSSLTTLLPVQQILEPVITESVLRGIADYVDPAFRWARESDPDAVLIINDNRTLNGLLIDKVEAILKELKRRNTPFDGVGIQAHMKPEGRVPLDHVQENFTRLSQYGRLYLTELDVPTQPPTPDEKKRLDWRPWDGWTEQTQAAYAVALYIIAFGHPAVDGITWWTFTDRITPDLALNSTGLLREDLSPRPAYEQLKKLIRETWWTRWSGATDNAGGLRLRAFLGEYRLVATLPDGRVIEVPFSVQKRDESIRLTLR